MTIHTRHCNCEECREQNEASVLEELRRQLNDRFCITAIRIILALIIIATLLRLSR